MTNPGLNEGEKIPTRTLTHKTIFYLFFKKNNELKIWIGYVSLFKIPVEQKRHEKHENDHWRILKG